MSCFLCQQTFSKIPIFGFEIHKTEKNYYRDIKTFVTCGNTSMCLYNIAIKDMIFYKISTWYWFERLQFNF